MLEVQIPADENERLATLESLNLLDTPLEERYERLTRLVCHTLNVPIASFTLIDTKRQWFKSIQGLSGAETARELSFCAHVVHDNDMLLVNDAQNDERFSDHPSVTGDPNIGFYAGFPVHAPDGKAIGALCAIDNIPRTMGPEQLQALRDLAIVVENELKLSVLEKQHRHLITELDAAQRLALIDPLTRLWNRNGMAEILKREWAEGIRKQTPIAFVMADIDHFKMVNDTHGHAAGDEVLRTVAKRLLKTLRTEDAIGRMGGEEFLIVMPGCSKGKLKATVERIRNSVVELPITTRTGSMPLLPITVSYGAVVVTPDATHTPEDMIKMADEALYSAKSAGRDCVRIAA